MGTIEILPRSITVSPYNMLRLLMNLQLPIWVLDTTSCSLDNLIILRQRVWDFIPLRATKLIKIYLAYAVVFLLRWHRNLIWSLGKGAKFIKTVKAHNRFKSTNNKKKYKMLSSVFEKNKNYWCWRNLKAWFCKRKFQKQNVDSRNLTVDIVWAYEV